MKLHPRHFILATVCLLASCNLTPPQVIRAGYDTVEVAARVFTAEVDEAIAAERSGDPIRIGAAISTRNVKVGRTALNTAFGELDYARGDYIEGRSLDGSYYQERLGPVLGQVGRMIEIYQQEDVTDE